MVKHYAFYFDSSSCSGCKACQVACKDKHTLETGILWRRVYEIAGGDWLQVGKAWTPHVFAYNLSIACNHCEKPVCLEVCPAGAYSKRNDGIVLLDTGRCLGCHYCEWACPYGAPQYDTKSGQMTKCNFCFDLIDAGQPPACVSACPMRALDYGDRTELEARYGRASAIFPLPLVELTQPALVITPHPDAREARGDAGRIANREEVHPV